jgi:hypothetical protein
LTYLRRILYSLLLIAILLDQAVALIIKIPFYICGVASKPNPAETISNIVGRRAMHGHRWAEWAEWIIDRVFYVFEGCKLGHCRGEKYHGEIDWEDANNHR